MLHYEIAGGHEQTCVLLHGFLESSSMWQVLELENDFRTVKIDLPGHGLSNLDGIDSMRSMAQKVQEVLEFEQIIDYNLIGHSMGGYVALELMRLDSEVRKLVLLNSNVWSDNASKKTDRKRVAELVQSKKEHFVSEAIPNLFLHQALFSDVIEELRLEAQQISAEAIARSSLAMASRTDYSEAVFNRELDVIVIQGDQDPIADKARMEQIMVHQPQNLHIVSSGHMAHWEATKAVRDILLTRLK
jgi:pimeloyl-ACP methyl ester carboxylesterase